MDNVTEAAGGSDNELHLDQFGLDDDDWYIMQCAYEHGRDPFEVVQVVRRRQAAQRRAQRHLAYAARWSFCISMRFNATIVTPILITTASGTSNSAMMWWCSEFKLQKHRWSVIQRLSKTLQANGT